MFEIDQFHEFVNDIRPYSFNLLIQLHQQLIKKMTFM